MTRLVLACALVAGCGGGKEPPPKVPTPPPPLPPAVAVAAVPELALSEGGLAGLDGKSQATLVALRKELAASGYLVKPDNNGSSLVFDVYRGAGDDKLFYVVPTDDGRLFNLHVTSTKIVSPQGWHVGGSLSDLSGMSCECWGGTGDEVATCFHPGEHVAVVYERACSGMNLNDDRNRKVLQGATISRLVWEPMPWAVDPPAKPPSE